MTVYDRELLVAIQGIERELREIRKALAELPRPLTAKDLPDLETYFESKEGK